ncbi:hypothetical protein OIU85_004459 [Salix viminalis]|uniref:Uncharacterized protein n=1 Tax=Salix viminalis TaxID=40686 RepID=A0A9Q0PSL8_SALVM|nr:hypothetical protein OIU85_004459 [Salix viminalis]
MDPRELKQGIAELYDQSSGVWEDLWGVHMHHGFYNPDDQVSGSGSDHRAAQIRMIEEALRFTAISGEGRFVRRSWVNLMISACGI